MSTAITTSPISTDSPRQARHVLTRQMSAWGLAHITDDVELIASELMTNAAQHGGGVRSLTLTARDGYVCVEVGDSDPTPPTPRAAESSDTSGRGLLLVAALSREWGFRLEGSGKVVWAEVLTDED